MFDYYLLVIISVGNAQNRQIVTETGDKCWQMLEPNMENANKEEKYSIYRHFSSRSQLTSSMLCIVYSTHALIDTCCEDY